MNYCADPRTKPTLPITTFYNRKWIYVRKSGAHVVFIHGVKSFHTIVVADTKQHEYHHPVVIDILQ